MQANLQALIGKKLKNIFHASKLPCTNLACAQAALHKPCQLASGLANCLPEVGTNFVRITAGA
jgi:hypothetical protein